MVSQAVGFDGAKQIKGRKRHMCVDTLGLVLRVLVTAASTPEREGGLPSVGEGQADGTSGVSPPQRLGGWRVRWQPVFALGDGCLLLDCAGGPATATAQGFCLAAQALGGRAYMQAG